MWELWGVEILAFPLTWHIAYTTACCCRTSHDYYLERVAPTSFNFELGSNLNLNLVQP